MSYPYKQTRADMLVGLLQYNTDVIQIYLRSLITCGISYTFEGLNRISHFTVMERVFEFATCCRRLETSAHYRKSQAKVAQAYLSKLIDRGVKRVNASHIAVVFHNSACC